MNTNNSPKAVILTAWIVVLLASALPKVILQEVFGRTVSLDTQALMSLSAGDARLVLGLVHPFLAGRVDFFPSWRSARSRRAVGKTS